MNSQNVQLAELTAALEHEIRLVGELTDAVIRQREGVVRDDASLVDATADEIGRTLARLDEARKGRAVLVGRITASDVTPLARIEDYVLSPLPERFVGARRELRRAAERVTTEMTINYQVLVRAVRSGEAFLQQLFAPAGERTAVYGHGEPAPPAPGAIVDRSV